VSKAILETGKLDDAAAAELKAGVETYKQDFKKKLPV
jgi:hypothetical protein